MADTENIQQPLDDIAVSFENVSKKYCKSISHSMIYGIKDIIRNSLSLSSNPDILREKEFWAVNDVSFSIKRGETIGIIGPNGSGKTSMLKMINGIFWPDKGKITISGSIGALIQVGAGFHPMLSGRENIYINGAILGMDRKEIDEKLDDIIEFADIGDFIDSPVKYYSSGMFVRLGFSVAIHAQPQILLIDEILAVGDQVFQNKCKRKLIEQKSKNCTIVIISHNIDMISMLCDRVLIMYKGNNICTDKTSDALTKYTEIVNRTEIELKSQSITTNLSNTNNIYARYFKLIGAELLNEKNEISNNFNMGEDIKIELEFLLYSRINAARFSLSIHDDSNINIIWQTNTDNNIYFDNIDAGQYTLDIILRKPRLTPKLYNVFFGLYDANTSEIYFKSESAMLFFSILGSRDISKSIITCETNWELIQVKS